MSLINTEHVARFLTELKTGLLLTRWKHNGEKYSRHYFLHEREDFVSYHNPRSVFAKPRRCKYNRIFSFLFKSRKYFKKKLLFFKHRLYS